MVDHKTSTFPILFLDSCSKHRIIVFLVAFLKLPSKVESKKDGSVSYLLDIRSIYVMFCLLEFC